MHENALRRLETEVGIREGIEANQFEVFYQPIVDTHTGRLIAAEALVRWNHPARGLLAPIEFIAVAEDTGLIIPLGQQVLVAAIRQTQEWKQCGAVDQEFYVSVNLSAHQLQDAGLVESVARALSESELSPDGLVLEVTESALVENLGVTVARLLALRALGVRLAIDDFGTGYSSLSYLADIPDQLRQDRQVVHRPNDARPGGLGRGARRGRSQPRDGLHLHRRRRGTGRPAQVFWRTSTATSSRDTSLADRGAPRTSPPTSRGSGYGEPYGAAGVDFVDLRTAAA